MAVNCYPYFTKKVLEGFFFKEKLGLSSLYEDDEGLYFSYQFGSIIITSVLHQWPKRLVSEVVLSGLEFFHNPSFIVELFSTALAVFTPRAKGKHRLCPVQCRACRRQ